MNAKRTVFAEPIFVTPHAIDRFQERIAPLDAERVIEVVQSELAHGRRLIEDHRPGEIVYQGIYDDKVFYVVIRPSDIAGEWPAAVSVCGGNGAEHGNLCKGRAYIRTQSVYAAVRGDAQPQQQKSITTKIKKQRPGVEIGADKVIAMQGRIRIAALINVAAEMQGETRKGVWEKLHKATGIYCPFPTCGALETFNFWHRHRIDAEMEKIRSGEISHDDLLAGWWWGDTAMRVVSAASGSKEEAIELSRTRKALVRQTLADPALTKRVVEDYYRMIEK